MQAMADHSIDVACSVDDVLMVPADRMALAEDLTPAAPRAARPGTTRASSAAPRGLFLPPSKCGSCGAPWPHITEIRVEPVAGE